MENNNMVFVNVTEWDTFLNWYGVNNQGYDWHPITMADKVNVYNKEFPKKLIAFKESNIGGNTFVIDSNEYQKFLDAKKELEV